MGLLAPHFKNLEATASVSPAGTYVGFHGIRQSDWNRIFGKMRKKGK